MLLNKFSDEEAIERCRALRDKLPLPKEEKSLAKKWADKDALAQVINLACLAVEAKQLKQEFKNKAGGVLDE